MPVDVILNVYDLIEQTPICCGFFHTGIEVCGVEYAFAGGAGIYDCAPHSAPDGRFRQAIVLGTVETSSIARAALDRLRPEFHGDTYSLVFKNCNDFCSAFSKAVIGRDIPGWINRLARWGRTWPIRCCLPPHLKASGAGSGSTSAPLLSGNSPSVSVFQGQGRSLRGSSSASAPSYGGSILGCVSRRIGSLLRRDTSPSTAGSALVSNPGEARELRAAAACRRFSEDAEAGGTGVPASAPMPNPWR
eukprot:gnl/TRDRNA2_/TRDRNA2_38885_c0_seq1.p1 gnl/TRDRNA2_/TRDRNA2_38885_c0~~gnl/TRDRNA2_/TRDRNA2_38885_c0_seq1.p1  ORF type:complete len:247 (-),score=21.49 gnl/TRDRNA2_/TRDRNA2_38885_c0_seq1:34-774(-)